MRYLLDTHILLWALDENSELSDKAKDIILNNEIVFSVVNIWEVAIKSKKDKNMLDPNLFYQLLLQNHYSELEVKAHHAIAVKDLPLIHKDPFDRILIAQAMSENLILMTADEKIEQYPNIQLLMV